MENGNGDLKSSSSNKPSKNRLHEKTTICKSNSIWLVCAMFDGYLIKLNCQRTFCYYNQVYRTRLKQRLRYVFIVW